MFVQILWIIILDIIPGNANLDPKGCIFGKESNMPLVRKRHCLVTKDDVKLSCPSGKIIILSSLVFAVKSSSSGCMKRILTHNEDFCCNLEDNDVLYDGYCLQDMWNNEDKAHYIEFFIKALTKCTNASRCVLHSELLANIHTEIPASNKHASYLQVLYRCIQEPTKSLSLCSSHSTSGKDIHFRDSYTTEHNKTCSCRVTSPSNHDVIVKAVDLRPMDSALILRSDGKLKNISEHQALYGFREIFSGKKIDISIRLGPAHSTENIWLYLTGSKGEDINVICGDTTPPIQIISQLPHDPVAPITRRTVIVGYWPLIYVAVGSIFTVIIVACILCGFHIWNKSKKPHRHHQHRPCGHAVHSCPAEFHQDYHWHHYATVVDGATHSATLELDPRVAVPGQRATLEPDCDKQYIRTYPVSRLAASNPSTSHATMPGKQYNDAARFDDQSPFDLTPCTSSNVSDLEAFLECKDHK